MIRNHSHCIYLLIAKVTMESMDYGLLPLTYHLLLIPQLKQAKLGIRAIPHPNTIFQPILEGPEAFPSQTRCIIPPTSYRSTAALQTMASKMPPYGMPEPALRKLFSDSDISGSALLDELLAEASKSKLQCSVVLGMFGMF